MKSKRFILFILIFSCLSTKISITNGVSTQSSNPVPQSCTIFTATVGDKVLFGNSEDYDMEGVYIWLIPSQEIDPGTPEGKSLMHGAIFFGFYNNYFIGDGISQGGMNDQGLCYDGNGLPIAPLNNHPEREDTYPEIHIGFQWLWELSTVEDAIEFYETYYLGGAIACQIHYADATGDAVVISAGVDEEFAYTRINDSNYLVSTNFNLANPSNGWYPCERYDTACSILDDINSEEDLTIDICRDVLNSVAMYQTWYSNIFDPVNRDVYLYYHHDFTKVVKLNLDDELAKIVPGAPEVQYFGFTHGRIYPSGNKSGIIGKMIPIADLFKPEPIYRIIIDEETILIISLVAIGIVGASSLIVWVFVDEKKKARDKRK